MAHRQKQHRQRPLSANPRLRKASNSKHENTNPFSAQRPKSARTRRKQSLKSKFFKNMYGSNSNTNATDDDQFISRESLRQKIKLSMEAIKKRKAYRSTNNVKKTIAINNVNSNRNKISNNIKPNRMNRQHFLKSIKQGTLIVKILSCKNLKVADEVSGASDPYITFKFHNLGLHTGKRYSTVAKFKTISPVFNETFNFRIYNMTNRSSQFG